MIEKLDCKRYLLLMTLSYTASGYQNVTNLMKKSLAISSKSVCICIYLWPNNPTFRKPPKRYPGKNMKGVCRRVFIVENKNKRLETTQRSVNQTRPAESTLVQTQWILGSTESQWWILLYTINEQLPSYISKSK